MVDKTLLINQPTFLLTSWKIILIFVFCFPKISLFKNKKEISRFQTSFQGERGWRNNNQLPNELTFGNRNDIRVTDSASVVLLLLSLDTAQLCVFKFHYIFSVISFLIADLKIPFCYCC